MTPGTILFDPNFKFVDGTSGEKLFVVLNDGSYKNQYLAVKTTSNSSRYNASFGCNIRHKYPNFFVPPSASTFKANTWIQLEDYYPFKANLLIQKVTAGKIYRISMLSVPLTKELLQCSIDSLDIPVEWEKALKVQLSQIV